MAPLSTYLNTISRNLPFRTNSQQPSDHVSGPPEGAPEGVAPPPTEDTDVDEATTNLMISQAAVNNTNDLDNPNPVGSQVVNELEMREEPQSLIIRKIDMLLDGWVGASSPTPSQQPPASFPLFGSLPYDMRRRIWLATMERRRLVNITTDLGLTSPAQPSDPQNLEAATARAEWRMLNRLPAVFAACSESRREARAFYRVHLDNRLFVNPEWDVLCCHIGSASGWRLAFPVEAILCNDVLRRDPFGVGVVHFARQGSFRRTDGTFLEPAAAVDLEPLAVTLRNLETLTEVYCLPLAGELQDEGRYAFPHWERREGYFERDLVRTEKGAYVLPADSEGYVAVLRGMREMAAKMVGPARADKVAVGTFHVMPAARGPSAAAVIGKESVNARIFVGQYGRPDNMFACETMHDRILE